MTNENPLDENLKRMFKSALEQPKPAFQDRLVGDVLAEVKRQARLEEARRPLSPLAWIMCRWKILVPAAAMAVVFIGFGIWLTINPLKPVVGRVSCLYGWVAVQKNGSLQEITKEVELRSGHRLKTRAGTQAQILLADKTRLVPEPRTSLQLEQTEHGPKIRLEQGALGIEASQQPPGKAITIEASRAEIKVLGTRLDVRLAEKPSGIRQTRVRVLSGKVEMASGGQKILLLPGTEGLADEGQPPVRSSLIFEVNELIRLWEKTKLLAQAQGGGSYGPPSSIDLSTSTIWSVVPRSSLQNALQSAGPGRVNLKLKFPAFRAKVYALDGTEIPSQGSRDVLSLDLSKREPSEFPEHVILKVQGVGGLLRESPNGGYDFSLPGNDSARPCLLQLQLTSSSQIEQCDVPKLETKLERDKVLVTVQAKVTPFKLVD